ncbi:MAG: hypothetical protein RHS_0506 [Robinsoniella sp. RHS]|nr:MAG: hypothetical protein RHS_0506 [Robinsoniella sp. RHS]
MKSFHIINKIACVIFILAAVFFVQTAVRNTFFPAAAAHRDKYHSQTAGTENQYSIYTAEHTINEQVLEHSVPPGRVLLNQVYSLFRGDLSSGSWISELYMPQSIYYMMFGGGVFLLFLYRASLPVQFYDKLNITHESDGKKRPL